MDQQGEGELTRYLPGSEAQLNHHALAEDILDDPLLRFLDDEGEVNPDDLSTFQQQHIFDNAFINDPQPQPQPQPHVQQFPQAQSMYPDLGAPLSTSPYYPQPQQYQQHQPLDFGGLVQPNPQFPPPVPHNIYSQQSHQLPQNPQNGSLWMPLSLEDIEAFKKFKALQAPQSQKALPPSQPSQSRPAPEDFDQPHRPNSPDSPSSSVEGFSRIPWGRKEIKKDTISTLVRKFYTEPIPKDLDWGTNPKKPVDKELGFKYTEAAQWKEHIIIGQDKLKFYLDNCSLNDKFPRNLRVWVQNHPAQANHRADPIDRKCRYRNCPAKGRTILAGWYRVAFDEFPKLTCSGKKDPFKMAGSMHLWCFEQCIDPADLYNKGVLKPDTRDLRKEEKNPMSLVKDAADRGITETFARWMKDHQHSGSEPFVPRTHKETLSFALCSHHVKNQTAVRQQTRDERNKKKSPGQKKTIDIHLGDLEMFTGVANQSNNQEDEEDFDEVGVVETDSVRAVDEAVVALLSTATSNVEPEYNANVDPLGALAVNPLHNAAVDPLGMPSVNTQYNAAFDPLGMPSVDPQPHPSLHPLDTPAPPHDILSFMNNPSQLDTNLFPLDPQLAPEFGDCAMPDQVGEEQAKGDGDGEAMEGVLTPRSVSRFEEHVEVQQEVPQVVSSKSPSSLFGSPIAISPKPKSPTKKRRRSLEDADEDYVPTSSPKRPRSADSGVPQTRRKSSARSPISVPGTRRRSSARSTRSAH